MWQRVVAVVAMVLVACPLYAQVEDTMLIGGDTLTYRYVPVDRTHVEEQSLGVESGRSILDYLTFGDRDLNPGASFTILGSPFYNQEQGWGIVLGGDMRYRTRRMTKADSPSTLGVRLSASLGGSYVAEIEGENWLGGDNHMVGYSLAYVLDSNDIWGLTFDAARGDRSGGYACHNIAVQGAYGYRVAENLMLGVHAGYLRVSLFDLSEWASEVLRDEVTSLSMVGVGVDLEYDTRHMVERSTKGLYIAMSYTLRSYLFDHIPMGHNVTLQLGYYQPLWRGATLKLALYGEYNSPDTPWMLRATIGGDTVMRGYYEGRYMADNLLSAEAELGQYIWQGLGVAVWGGAGTLFSHDDPFAWRKVLPTYGVGIRWGLGDGASLRIDMAFGRGSKAIIAGFSEAF